MAHKLPLADIQFIADFAAFCRTKGDEGYDYHDVYNCAGAQFVTESGRAPHGACYSTDDYYPRLPDGGLGDRVKVPSVVGSAVSDEPYTFSALADRLEALIADAPTVERAQ